MVATHHLIGSITNNIEKIFVCGQNLTVQVEFDDSLRSAYSGKLRF